MIYRRSCQLLICTQLCFIWWIAWFIYLLFLNVCRSKFWDAQSIFNCYDLMGGATFSLRYRFHLTFINIVYLVDNKTICPVFSLNNFISYTYFGILRVGEKEEWLGAKELSSQAASLPSIKTGKVWKSSSVSVPLLKVNTQYTTHFFNYREWVFT